MEWEDFIYQISHFLIYLLYLVLKTNLLFFKFFISGFFLKFGSRLMLANKDSVVEKILLPEKKELENQLLDAIADEVLYKFLKICNKA